jgi:signal transduction histidine kinase
MAMKDVLEKFIYRFFDESLDFRVRLFNVLAMAGTLISFLMMLVSFTMGIWGTAITNGVATILSGSLLVYSYKSGRYRTCYLITIFAIFICLFPILFFTSGGYHSGMPAFFVFSVLFTVLMLDKWKAIVMSLIEIVLYTSICLIAYFYPETVICFNNEAEIVTDIIVSFVLVSVACGIVLYLHLREYIRQQALLKLQNDKLKKYDDMKSTFLTTVAHEIKNPLTTISVHARDTSELLNEQPQDMQLMKENLKTIEQVVMRIDRIVLDLMDTVSIEQGRLALLLAPVRLSDILQRACKTYFEGTNTGGNMLTLELDDTLPPLQADYARLLQVVINLLSNATRHTKNGNIVVSLRADSNYQLVSIADNGEGMDEKMRKSAFKGYVSAHKDYWRHGIGLYVCHQIITAHGGKIWLESKQGNGTNVSFTVPVVKK